MDEWLKLVMSAAGGGFVATWGMLGWTNGRIRNLEINRVTPEACNFRHSAIENGLTKDVKKIAEAVARIEGHLGIAR